MISDLQSTKPREIFRKAALDRLSSPDQLDLLSQVVGSKGWMVLITLCFAVLVATGWGVFGEIPSKVSGQAMITQASGIFDVPATAQGRVAELKVAVGDLVKAGQVVARIEQPELVYEVSSLNARISEFRAREDSLKTFSKRGVQLQGELLTSKQSGLNARLAQAERNIATLQERIRADEQLLERGLITRQTLLDSQLRKEQVNQEIRSIRSELGQLSLQNLEGQKQLESELANARLQISDLVRQRGALEERVLLQSEVRSPYGGRVLEIRSGRAGSLVGLGSSLFTLERENSADAPLEVIVFVSAFDGPAVKVGMDVQINPGNVKPEEHGFMLGRVRWVASYPASDQGIKELLQNDKLVGALSGSGPPIKIVADLIPDKSTPSGYRWSSRQGPNFELKSGTLAKVSITTETRHPIELVIPALRKFMGV